MELEDEARALGSNAIVGIYLDYETIVGKRSWDIDGKDLD